ncbi:MAG: GntR family transcriptional regulator [Alphaproteobacteria bacterium]|nr:GntR family transcriptional regulator [Alphaproteobacteria bacterium]
MAKTQNGSPDGLAEKKFSKDDVLTELRRQILTMELAPGEPLDETGLGQVFGLSRTPMREVLRQLSGEGYTLIRVNKGGIVSPMDPIAMRNFFLSAPMIYSAISRLAAQCATRPQIDELADIQIKFKAEVAAQSVDGMVYYNDRFHHQIGVMSGNPYLMPSLQRLLIDHARIGQTFWKPTSDDRASNVPTASQHHDEFIEVFAAGDEDAAVRLTLEHWELSRHYMDLFIHPVPLDFSIDGHE